MSQIGNTVWFARATVLLVGFAGCKPKPNPSLAPVLLNPGQPTDPCLLDCSERLGPWPEAWRTEIVDTEDCVRYAPSAVGFEGTRLSLCPFQSAFDTIPGQERKRQKLDLGDRVIKCLTGRTRKGMEATCDLSFRSSKLTPVLRLEYRGKDRTVANQLLRFAGEVAMAPVRCGTGNLVECALCQIFDIRFLQSQERIIHDDLLLPGEAPSRPPVWPPDLPPDQDKPAPTCTKQERAESPVSPEDRCYMHFDFARGSSFALSKVRPATRPDCEDASVFVKDGASVGRTIGVISSCSGDVPRRESEEGGKDDRWHGRGWMGDVVVEAFDLHRWVAKLHIHFFGHRFPSFVTIQSEPLHREDMRSFLLAASNGGFYPADCKASVVPGACDPCREIRANRQRWHDPRQDLLRLFESK